MLFDNIIDAIGHTPLVKLKSEQENSAAIYAKLEKNNPSGSVKDRPVKYILKDLMDKGEIEVGGSIVESTSGNTGVGLAMAGAALGIHVIIVMPESMSVERRQLIQAYGAELVLTDPSGGMKLAGDRAQEIAEEKGIPMFSQFSNIANVTSHEETTANEILEDLPNIDGFVAGVGTGGTITGVGKVLKDKNPDIQIWTVEPDASPILTKGEAGSHKIQGLGANFVPEILDQGPIDQIELVSNDDAIQAAVNLAKDQGILAGYSAGANYVVAKRLAEKLGSGKKVVVIFPDSGERYLSGGFFGDGKV